jgi:hypothetical protein
MIAIRVPRSTRRLEYTLDFIFREVLGLSYRILEAYQNPEGAFLIHYGLESAEGLFIPSSGLLFEDGIRTSPEQVSEQRGLPLIFRAENQDFDLFSAVFYCLSRYEEYQFTGRDEHGRFQVGDSMFARWVEIPFVDRWIIDLGMKISELGGPQVKPPNWLWYNTLDVDIAYAFRGRRLGRYLGATAKDVLKFNPSRLVSRLRVTAKLDEDPFDTYSLYETGTQYADRNLVFIPAGKRAEFDHNLDVRQPALRELMRRLSEMAEVGMHPSYESLDHPDRMATEKHLLEEVLGEEILISRQHFLRFRMPDTFRHLSRLGIREDFSMGYHDAVGFRSGTAYPHRFFDLMENRVIDIRLFPLIAMDSALKNYMRITPEQAFRKMQDILSQLEMTGGVFTTVWHNHSMSDYYEWKGWRKVYTQFIEHMERVK